MGTSWTQTPEGRKKMSEIQKRLWAEGRSGIQKRSKRKKMQAVAKMLVTKAKKYPKGYKNKQDKQFALIINGWRITLGKGEVRIDNE